MPSALLARTRSQQSDHIQAAVGGGAGPSGDTHVLGFVALALATSLGIGYVPFAPGTFGSMVGLLAWAVLPGDPAVQASAIALLFLVGSWSGSVAEAHFGRADPGPVVIDEVMGMLITLFMSPAGWQGALAGFVLFRFFDVIKPYPSNRLERLPGGVGVMADDAMAAVYANLALRACVWVGHRLGA